MHYIELYREFTESWNPPFNAGFVHTRNGGSRAQAVVIVIHVYVVSGLNRLT